MHRLRRRESWVLVCVSVEADVVGWLACRRGAVLASSHDVDSSQGGRSWTSSDDARDGWIAERLAGPQRTLRAQ